MIKLIFLVFFLASTVRAKCLFDYGFFYCGKGNYDEVVENDAVEEAYQLLERDNEIGYRKIGGGQAIYYAELNDVGKIVFIEENTNHFIKMAVACREKDISVKLIESSGNFYRGETTKVFSAVAKETYSLKTTQTIWSSQDDQTLTTEEVLNCYKVSRARYYYDVGRGIIDVFN